MPSTLSGLITLLLAPESHEESTAWVPAASLNQPRNTWPVAAVAVAPAAVPVAIEMVSEPGVTVPMEPQPVAKV